MLSIFQQLDRLKRLFTWTMSIAFHLLIILIKIIYQMPMSKDKNVAIIVHLDLKAINHDSLVVSDSIVDSNAKGI